MMSDSSYYSSTFWNLAQAISDRQVVAFVGAGVSRSIRGTPDWNECIEKLLDAVKKNAGVNTGKFG